MNCVHCGSANPDSANFCAACGRPIIRNCRHCGGDLPAGAQFCPHCGRPVEPGQESIPAGPAGPSESTAAEELLARYIPPELLEKLQSARARGGMAGERRVITALFCDVTGSTAAAETLDPEDWAEIMNGAFEHLIRPVFRYEGTVARLMGDAILAFFGAPIAHEDDPERAVLAGLEILSGIRRYRERVRERWGLEFDVRVGINTGLVVVGEIGSDLRMEYTAMGDAINLAARMEQTAQAGTVQIAEDTLRRVAGLFDVQDLGPLEVRGKEAPVRAYRVLGPRAQRGSSRGIPGHEAPLIGRAGEMSVLEAALQDLEAGIGGIVCLTGEAGLGKSRLVREFRARAVEFLGLSEDQWLESRALSYQASVPYAQIQQLLRNRCGISPSDPPEQINQQIERLSASLPDELASRAAPAFRQLLGSAGGEAADALQGESFRYDLLAVLSELLGVWSEDRPLVLVNDDLHWADPASVGLLQDLLILIERHPLLWVEVFRPDRQAPSWELLTFAEREYPHRFIELALSPLRGEDSASLIDQLLSVADLPAALKAWIVGRAAGNPLFVEEIVRGMIEQGLLFHDAELDRWRPQDSAEIALPRLPENLRAVLAARIDRLEEGARQVLQLASVIGERFYFRVLAGVLENGDASREPRSAVLAELKRNLTQLQRTGLIQEVARLPEQEYAFRHALTREAAYETMLFRKRKEYHARVAEVMEREQVERIDELAGRLAWHFDQGEDARALNYYLDAGDHAARLYANQEAVRYFSRALELADRWPREAAGVDLAHLYTARGRAFELDSKFLEALSNYEAMEQFGEQSANPAIILEALIAQAKLRCTPTALSDPEAGEALCKRALALAEELEDEFAEARIYWNYINLYRLTDRHQVAHEFGARAVEMLERIHQQAPADREIQEQLAFAHNDYHHVALEVDGPAPALDHLAAAGQLWRALDNRPMLADSLSSAATAHLWLNHTDEALAYSNEAYEISRKINNLWGMSYSRYMIGMHYSRSGYIDQAIEIMADAVANGDRAGFPVASILTRSLLALLYLGIGSGQRAQELIERVLDLIEGRYAQIGMAASAIGVEIFYQQGDRQRAEELLRHVGEQHVGMNSFLVLLSLLSKAKFAFQAGDHRAALRLTERLIALSERLQARFFLTGIRLLKGKVLAARGRPEEARAELLRALADIRSDNARWELWQVLAELAPLEALLGNPEAAQTYQEEAWRTVEWVAGRIADPELKAAFRTLPQVQNIWQPGDEPPDGVRAP